MFTLENLKYVTLFLYLLRMSVEDIRYKSVPYAHLAVGAGLMLLFYLGEPFSVFSLIFGIGTGILLIVCSVLTKGSVGIGDGVILAIIGMAMGFSTIYILIYSFLAVSATAFLLLTLAKKQYRYEIPLIPFYLLGFSAQVLYEKIL